MYTAQNSQCFFLRCIMALSVQETDMFGLGHFCVTSGSLLDHFCATIIRRDPDCSQTKLFPKPVYHLTTHHLRMATPIRVYYYNYLFYVYTCIVPIYVAHLGRALAQKSTAVF